MLRWSIGASEKNACSYRLSPNPLPGWSHSQSVGAPGIVNRWKSIGRPALAATGSRNPTIVSVRLLPMWNVRTVFASALPCPIRYAAMAGGLAASASVYATAAST